MFYIPNWPRGRLMGTLTSHMLILQAAIDSVNTHKIGLKSPLMTPVGKGFRSLNLALR